MPDETIGSNPPPDRAPRPSGGAPDETIGMVPAAGRDSGARGAREDLPGPIGPYRLLERLGEGGMGEVYLAEQTGAIRRHVALKIIKQGMDTREVVARFMAERQALAMMDHPCIARAFDAGATEQGRPYFVMEYVDGLPITDYCDRHRLGTRERLRLFIRVCDGVQHAHQKAIIHRDLKPHNVLVTLVDGQPVPKIIDFGIAKATGQALTEQTMFTALGQMVGTPEYMSPEQVEMAGEDIDTRTDVYSLGVILYELLAGAPPFDPAEFRREGFEAIRRRIREQDPVKPSTRVGASGSPSTLSARDRGISPDRLATELRGDLDWITLKALEKDRARRYATVNGLAQDIQRHLNHEPVLASPPSATYLMAKLVRRHRTAFAALGAILVILAGAAALSTTLYFQARRESRRAHEEAARSEQVATFMRDMLAGVGPSVAQGRDTKMLREILEKTGRRVERGLAGQPVVEAEMRSVLGTTYADLGEYETARSNQEHAHALLLAQVGERDPRTLRIAMNLGELQYRLGNLQAAESILVRTGVIQDEVLGREHPQSLATAGRLMAVYAYDGALDKADSLGQRVVPAMRRVSGDADPETRSAMYTLASVYVDQLKLGKAESLYVDLLRVQSREDGPEHPNTLSGRVGLGWVYRMERRYPEAERETREALAAMRRVMGNDHSETLVAVNNLGIIYSDMKLYDKAAPLYRENYESGVRVLGPRHPETIAALVNLACFDENRGRYREGERLASESLDRFQGVVPDDHPGRGIAFLTRGVDRAHLGRDREAEHDLLEANRILLPKFGPDHRRIHQLRETLRGVYQRLGRPDDAAKWQD